MRAARATGALRTAQSLYVEGERAAKSAIPPQSEGWRTAMQKTKKKMENRGFEPMTYRMRSDRSAQAPRG